MIRCATRPQCDAKAKEGGSHVVLRVNVPRGRAARSVARIRRAGWNGRDDRTSPRCAVPVSIRTHLGATQRRVGQPRYWSERVTSPMLIPEWVRDSTATAVGRLAAPQFEKAPAPLERARSDRKSTRL